MTLNDLVAVNLHYFTKFGSFGANYVKVVEGIDQYVSNIRLTAIFAQVTENKCINKKHPCEALPLS